MTHLPPDATADALFGRSRRAILTLLFGQTRQAYYLREIAQRTGLAVGSIQRELANLVRGGIIEREAQGAQMYFRANERSPVYGELVGLMTKTTGLGGVLQGALKGLAEQGRIDLAFAYGSTATGSQRAGSDVDLMVIGSVTLRELAPALRPAQQQLDRELNPTVYRPDEFRQRLAAGEHFLRRVLETPRVMLVGSDDALGKMAG
ncbi:MAG: nucleotidyltransferase domain-containing protein [Gemmatimonadales bacterium]|nr:nucleotidyltransferase domain-containing protein [Gemmatimonadales bacterium]